MKQWFIFIMLANKLEFEINTSWSTTVVENSEVVIEISSSSFFGVIIKLSNNSFVNFEKHVLTNSKELSTFGWQNSNFEATRERERERER